MCGIDLALSNWRIMLFEILPVFTPFAHIYSPVDWDVIVARIGRLGSGTAVFGSATLDQVQGTNLTRGEGQVTIEWASPVIMAALYLRARAPRCDWRALAS